MPLAALGVNHATAPMAVRELLAVVPAGAEACLRGLAALPGVSGALLLSTCNRTEIYLDGKESLGDAPVSWFLRERGLNEREFGKFFYQRHQADAVRHVFRVATGLDSMVLGEPQILGQLKDAYQSARAAEVLAPNLDRLLQRSFAVAKQVRTETGLGLNPVSMASAAVRLAKQVYDDFECRTALIVGAGATAELVARHLQTQGLKRLVIANRTLARGQALAERLNAQAIPMSSLAEHLADADIVVCATTAGAPVLSVEGLRAILPARRRRTLLMIDLGMPRDIEPGCGELRDCFLYAVDDLKQVVEHGQAQRRSAAEAAELQIELQVTEFMTWLHARDKHEPLLALRRQTEQIRDQELQQALRKLSAGGDPAEILRRLAYDLSNKFQHAPTETLRVAAGQNDAALIAAARKLFKL